MIESQWGGSAIKGSVLISFDDAGRSVYDYALPIIREESVDITWFIDTAGIDSNKQRGGALQWWQIQEINEDHSPGKIFVGSHGHKHIKMASEATIQQAKEDIEESIKLFGMHGINPVVFTPPYHDHSEEIRNLARKYFVGMRGGDGNTEVSGLIKPHEMNNYNCFWLPTAPAFDKGLTYQEIKSYIDYVNKTGAMLFLYGHGISPSGVVSREKKKKIITMIKGRVKKFISKPKKTKKASQVITTKTFQEMLQYIKGLDNTEIITVEEACYKLASIPGCRRPE